jgi:hypothetical protein
LSESFKNFNDKIPADLNLDSKQLSQTLDIFKIEFQKRSKEQNNYIQKALLKLLNQAIFSK